MTGLLDITLLQIGDEIHHALQIADVLSRSGDYPRTVLVLRNRTGRIESAPFWAGRDDMVRGLVKGMHVQVVGKVTAYRDARQIDVASVRPLPHGTIPLHDLMATAGPVEKYWSQIDEARAAIAAPRLAATVDLFYANDGFRAQYGECPGSPGNGHHALIGGLLQHTTEVVAIARQIARVARADEELVIAGALLHDIGKLDCYTWRDGMFETTPTGRIIGHVVQGALMLERAIAAAPARPCTPLEEELLLHMILSHHGKHEFGSPVLPATLEAEVVHFADDASAKAASFHDAYASAELFPEGARVSRRKVWSVDRWLYRNREDWGRDDDGVTQNDEDRR